MRHGRHGGGLHQRRGMFDRAGNPHRARPPGCIGTGVGGGGFGAVQLDGAGVDRKLRHGAPVMGLVRCGLRGPAAASPLRRRDGLAEQVAAGAGGDRRGCDVEPRRHLPNDGIEQFGCVRGAGCPVDLDSRLAAAVQHGQAGVESGAAPGIGAPIDRHGEDAARRRIETAEGVRPCGIPGHAVGRCDRHEPPARRQHGEGRAKMAEVRVVADAVDAGRCREGRVHQHDGRADVVQPVGDGLGVEGGDYGLREEKGQKTGAGGSDLVEMQIAGGALAERALGHHREHAGAGRRLQHGVARPDGGGLERGIGERQRRRELLQADLLLRAPGVRGLQRRDGIQHRQHAARPVGPGAGVAAHGPAVALKEQDGCGFGGLVGVLPDPGARRHPTRRTPVSWRPGGSRHRAAGRPPGPAAGSGPRRTGHRPR